MWLNRLLHDDCHIALSKEKWGDKKNKTSMPALNAFFLGKILQNFAQKILF
jgi:hypothetical protein